MESFETSNPFPVNSGGAKLGQRKQELDRLPPHSPESEIGVLGCILLSPEDCLNECLEKMPDNAFFDLRNQEIFNTAKDMAGRMEPVDVITLAQKLKDRNMLDEVGGYGYLSQLQDSVPSASNLSYYLDVVIEKSLMRRMISTCTHIISRVYEHAGSSDSLVDEVERDVLAIKPASTGKNDIKSVVSNAMERIELMWKTQGAISGLSTGLIDLDRQTDGVHPGEMVTIAAFPSCGKSALAAGIAYHNALAGIPVVIFTLEMAPEAIAMRGISSESRVNLFDVRRNLVIQADFERMANAAKRISNAPVFIENVSGQTISQIRAKARRLVQHHGVKLAVVDYMQLVTNPESDNREQEVSAISKGCKAIAMEHGIPVLALSQLNDDGKVRESRAISQDTDSLWVIKPQGDREPQIQPVHLVIEKCRDGEVGSVELTFIKKFTRFECASRITDSDVPARKDLA